MSPLARLLLTLLIIFISLAAGMVCQRVAGGADKLAHMRKRIQAFAIYLLMPVSAAISLWGFPSPQGYILLVLPLLGLFSYLAGGLMAWLAAAALKLSPRQTGSFICCGSFSNIAAIGGLICLLCLGENTIALVALYRLLEEVFYFGVAFPVARGFSRREPAMQGKWRPDPFLPLIVSALGLGIMLNLAGVHRPPQLGNLASTGMLLATTSFLFSIGTSLRISRVRADLIPALCMCCIKFLALPLAVCLAAWLLGAFDNRLAFNVVLVLSSMPVAMTALAPPTLFNLDVDLANTCWIVTTLALVLVAPVLMAIISV